MGPPHGLAFFFAAGTVMTLGHHRAVRFIEVSEAAFVTVARGNARPQQLACFAATSPDGVSNDLPRSPTQHQPDPAFMALLPDKRPHLVGFQHVPLLSRRYARLKGGQPISLFFGNNIFDAPLVRACIEA
jgi:hypothetical protein